MFDFRLVPGHTTPTDGLLVNPGAFELSGNLVPGHSNTADGLLVPQIYFATVTVDEGGGSVDGTATLTGVTATAGVGIIVATGSASVSIPGVTATGSAGTLTAFGDANVDLSGVSATASVGTITATGDGAEVPSGGGGWLDWVVRPRPRNGTARMIGVGCRASAGRIIATGSASAPMTGVTMRMSAGTMNARGIQNPTDEQLLAALELLQN